MTNPETPNSATTSEPARVAQVVLEIVLDADTSAVWKGLTDDIGAWWPADAYAGGEPGSRSFHLEAKPGGRMIEDWGGGGGLLWAQVLSINPGRSLELVGHTSSPWGGPNTWIGSLTLEAEGERTRLRFEDSTFGHIGDGHAADKEAGWRYLFGDALRAHVEAS